MNIWDQLVDCICRPPRDVYSPAELLGGSNQTFMVGAMECTRLDYELVNKEGMKLQCSHYLPLDAKSQDGKLPVVIYCHCNSGSRRDAEEALYHLLPCGVGVVAFDFTGSGLSDGKWVTLGAHEVEDLSVVVQHLRAQGGVSSIGLWGRSMGAVTALMYSHRDPDIAGMVLDSPFSRLTDLMLEIVVSQRLPIPKVMLKLALRLMRNSVRRKAGCDITTVSPLDVVARAVIPAMFGHGEEDSFISLQHSVKLYEAYNTAADAPVYKNLVRFKGDHNHPRPAFFYSSVCCFFHQQLKLDQVLLGGNPADTQQLMQYGSLTLSSANVSQLFEAPRANGFINTPWSLEPVSSLTHDQQAAAAAVAAEALLAEEGGGPGADGVGSSSSSGAAAGGSSSGSGAGFRSPPRVAAVRSSRAGPQGSSGDMAHISEGGLNSPRASATRGDRRGGGAGAVLFEDALGPSYHRSGEGVVRQGWGGPELVQHQLGSGPGSPVNPAHRQQQHRHPQHAINHRQQFAQQQQQLHPSDAHRNGSVRTPHLQQHQHQHPHQQHHRQAAAAAVPVPGGGGRLPAAAVGAGDEAFIIGSRGAPAESLSAHEDPVNAAGGGVGTAAVGPAAVGHRGVLRSPSDRGMSPGPSAAGTAAAAAAGGTAAAAAAAGGTAAAAAAAGGTAAAAGGTVSSARDIRSPQRSASSHSRGSSAAGAFVAQQGQHLKQWLFKRSGSSSSAGGSTPSASPPVAAAEGGLFGWPKSAGGSCHTAGGPQVDSGAVGGAAAAGTPLVVPDGGPQPSQQLLWQQQQQTHSSSRLSAASNGGSAPAPAAPGKAVGVGVDAFGVASLAVGPGEDAVDAQLAAAIAASIADQQQGPRAHADPQQQQQQQGPGSVEEEERMLQQALALSLAEAAGPPAVQDASPPQQQQELQQQPAQAQQQQQQLVVPGVQAAVPAPMHSSPVDDLQHVQQQQQQQKEHVQL